MLRKRTPFCLSPSHYIAVPWVSWHSCCEHVVFGLSRRMSRNLLGVWTVSYKSPFLLDSLKSFPLSSWFNSLEMESFRSQAGKLAINVKAEFVLVTSAASDSICWCLSCSACPVVPVGCGTLTFWFLARRG